MADKEHLYHFAQGRDAWNTWRGHNPIVQPDLSRVDLKESYLCNVDLSRTDLNGATLDYADLSGAFLVDANLTKADLIGTDLSRANLSDVFLVGANLFRANLTGADLSRANFEGADLKETLLRGAKFSMANLNGADLSGADLSGASLIGASLVRADLSRANLSMANLRGANLNMASLSRTGLNGTDLTGVQFSDTTFVWVNLSSVEGLETAIHYGPSCVDIKSVTLPREELIRQHFLRNTGFSDTFIDYLPSLLTLPIQYHSLFLSYSHHDEIFAKRLYANLQKQGVRCWFAPHDLRPGTPIVRGIEEAIHVHEKFLLILSTDAVMSNWVQQEVEAALYKEVISGQETLFPIRLDNAILASETLWAKRLCQRHFGDFTCWQDEIAYQQAFSMLLQHLKVTQLLTATASSSDDSLV